MPDKPGYISWKDDKTKALAFEEVGRGLAKAEPILRGTGSSLYFNVAPNNTSVRDGFNRLDYENFRYDEAMPVKDRDVIMACEKVYNSPDLGLIRNIIDLMADFTVKGIDITHPNERIEKFHKNLFAKWDGFNVSERFCNILYRLAAVIMKRHTAKLTVKNEEDLKRAQGTPDIPKIEEDIVLDRREIPWGYTFYDPASIELLGEELVPLIGRDAYLFGIRIPSALVNKIMNPRSSAEKLLVSKLPEEIRSAIKKGTNIIELNPEKTMAYYYKKDDWKPWPKPLIYSVLGPINLLRKMQLADLAALDGAISSIRVWSLGSIEAGIMPSEATILRLAQVLANNVGGGVMDLVWGPDIKLVETSTEIHRFLGDSKYAATLNAIYTSLGIPPTLTGSIGTPGTTNNFISLKTLTERLEYGRRILKSFWDEELRLVQKAMKFRFPATVTFDNVLSDDAQQKQLWINLADRDLVSMESLQEMFGLTPEIEAVRIRRENRRRTNGDISPKASPFHSPQQQDALKKLFVQTGEYTPSQFGIDLQDQHPSQTPPKQLADKRQAQLKPKGQPGQGRPINSNDKVKRKTKVFRPRTSAQFIDNLAIAEDMLGKLSKMVTGPYLKSISKKTLRELTTEEVKTFEDFKFSLLYQFSLAENVDEKNIEAKLASEFVVPQEILLLLNHTVAKYVEKNGKEPSLETLRRFHSSIYAMAKGEYDEEAGDTDNDLSAVS